VIRERGTDGLKWAEEQWKFLMSDEEKLYGEEIFVDVFKSLWPQKTAELWKDWESLPLDISRPVMISG